MGRSGVILVLWVLVMVQCVRTEDRSGVRGAMRQAEDAFRREMVIEPVRYSDPNLTLTYRATTEFNARGMGNLYKVTNFFMDIIQRADPYPEGKSCLISITGYKKMIAYQLVEIGLFFCWVTMGGHFLLSRL
jgi:prominin 1